MTCAFETYSFVEPTASAYMLDKVRRLIAFKREVLLGQAVEPLACISLRINAHHWERVSTQVQLQRISRFLYVQSAESTSTISGEQRRDSLLCTEGVLPGGHRYAPWENLFYKQSANVLKFKEVFARIDRSESTETSVSWVQYNASRRRVLRKQKESLRKMQTHCWRFECVCRISGRKDYKDGGFYTAKSPWLETKTTEVKRRKRV